VNHKQDLFEKNGDLQKKQAVLDKLNTEKAALAEKIEALKVERSACVRALAAGDDAKRKMINALEEKIAPLQLRLEGLEDLIKETEAEVKAADDLLQQAKEDADKALGQFLQQRENEEREALVADVTARATRIFELQKAMALELGELEIEAWRWGGHENPLWDILRSIHHRIAEGNNAAGFKAMLFTRIIAPIEVYPLADPALGLPGSDVYLSPAEISKVRRKMRHDKFLTEFEKGDLR
jgi:hypothetical protein